MKHYRVIYIPNYVAHGNGIIEDIGGMYWLQKRSLFGWFDYEQVPHYAHFSGEDAARYHCNIREAQYKIDRMKRFIVIKDKKEK